jgi:hypothetical protein
MSDAIPGILVVGQDWVAPVAQAKSEWSMDANGDKVVVYYRDVWPGWRGRVPVVNTPWGLSPYLLCVSAIARQIEPGFLCEVEVTFQQQIASGPTPDTQVTQNASAVRESITKHPNFTATGFNWQQWWNTGTNQFDPNWVFIPNAAPIPDMPSYLIGLTDYDVGSLTTTVTDYFASDPGSIEGLVGKLGFPPDADGAPDTYLCISGAKGRSGQWYTRSLVYQYSVTPLSEDVYPSS